MNHEPVVILMVEATEVESVHEFIAAAGLAQWNRVRILPCQSMLESMAEMERLRTMV